MRNRFEIRQASWFSDEPVTIEFPEHWDIRLFSPPEFKGIGGDAIGRAIENPLGSKKLGDLVLPGKKVVIVCDDISRPTRTDIILPTLISKLENLGILRENIAILISSGTHDLMNRDELTLKLGKEICREFKIHLHQYRKGNVFVGKTSLGTPVYLNQRLTQCDLIIGVGGIVPHNPAGFGGGAKLILGVCGIRTILHFHQLRKGVGTGGDVENEFQQDVQEAARMAGMDFILNGIVNRHRELIKVYGDWENHVPTHSFWHSRNDQLMAFR